MLKKSRNRKSESRSWARKLFLASLLGGLSTAGPIAVGQTQIANNPGYAPYSAAAVTPQGNPQLSPLPTGVGQPTANVVQPAPASQSSLKTYNLPSGLVGSIGAQLQVKYHSNPSVRVTTDPNSGALMVMAPPAVHQELSQQLAQLMQQNRIASGDIGGLANSFSRAYTLRNLSWRELEDALVRLGGSKLAVTTDRNGEVVNLQIANRRGGRDILQIDRRTNTVNMLGDSEEIAGWAQVVQTLDQGQADPIRSTHVVPLAPAAPRKVKQAFQMVKATIQEQQGQAEAQVNVDDNERATAMGTLDDLGAGSGLFGDVQIEFIEEIDLVIIRGSKDDVRRTLEVIERIKEQAEKTQPEIVVYPLKHANGEAVEALVSELYEEVYAARQGNISISALVQPNALLLIGRAEVVQTVQELIEKIDVPLDPQNQLKVIPLLHASAVDIEERVRSFFTADGDGGDVRPGLATRVIILGDYRTNSLIVQASPRELIEVEQLIAKLDVETAAAANDVQVFKLKNALAEELQTVLEEIIGGQTTVDDGSQATPPSGKVSLVTVSGNRVESGILAGVVISADVNNNQLIVRAPSQSMLLIGNLIDELDQPPGAEARIKVFQLQNGDATTMAASLQGLFGLAVTAGQSATGNFLNNSTRNNISTGGESSLIQLQISPEGRTNSIIVSGSESDLQVVEALILRLDEDVLDKRISEVVWLRNAFAPEVQVALSSYFDNLFQNEQGLVQQQIISAAELANRRVFVVAEEATNSILISADESNFEEAMRLIERLDRRPPMIAIQILVAEVQLDDQFELGAEWGLQDGLLFDRQASTGGTLGSSVFNVGNPITGPSGGAGQTQNVAGQVLSSFGVGRASTSGPGGVILSASSEAVGVLLRALQTANRAQILNRPTITTLENRVAAAQVGQFVPRVTSVTQGNGITPQQINTNDTRVGLILEVRPRVNADGLILCEVNIENSSLGDPDTGIPIGFGQNGEVIRSPIIQTTNASTTVSAYSGQTVVFGGLISKSRTSARTQVPILGSLPLIGPAFRFDVESEQRRELLIVLTPRVINTDEDYDVLKEVESSRMSWCLADVLSAHGDVGLSGGNGLWGPAKSATIYPDMPPSTIDDRSVPRPQSDYGQPMIMEEINLNSTPTIIESPAIPIEPAPLGSEAMNTTSPSAFQTASYRNR